MKSITLQSIILSASLFGSFYLFSTSLICLNKKWITNKPVSLYDIVNGSVLVFSGSIITATIYNKFM